MEKELSEAIEKISSGLTWHSSLVKLAGGGQVAFLPDSHWLSGIAFHYASLANQDSWKFEMYGTSSVQMCKFTSGTFHEWHSDALGFKDAKQLSRKLTIIIDYQSGKSGVSGGNLELLLTEQDSSEKIVKLDRKIDEDLSVHVFPSYIPFRVSEISKGEREFILCWGLGPQFV
jgi:hypothetical protein